MELSKKLLSELQTRLKIGNRRGVHLNAIPSNSRYKFDLNRLSTIDPDLPNNFIKELLSQLPLKFKISWKDNVPDLNSLFEEDQTQLVKITKAFENLINQTEAIESEKGINTFGFGFPILARRDKADNKLTVAPILIWSLRIKRTREFNTWEILRNEDDPIYINEVLINHLQSDTNVAIDQIPSEMLNDGLIDSNELIEICANLLSAINTSIPSDLKNILEEKLQNIKSIGDKNHYEKLSLNFSNSVINFSGLFSIFEVQKQNIINDYDEMLKLEGQEINLDDLEENSFQPISSVETDPSQQSILHALESKRNLLIQGPPGTGKSQTLTAVLINALENNKKTIVVCEKRTALEVLYNSLNEKGLSNNCVLIRDIVKDRKIVVDSVRDRVEDRKNASNSSKESLDTILIKATNLIKSINKKHQKIGAEILGTDNWTNIVGKYLNQTKTQNTEAKLKIDNSNFSYSSNELNGYLDSIKKGHYLHNLYTPLINKTFINPLKFTGGNHYLLKQTILNDIEEYKDLKNAIIELKNNSNWWQKIWFPRLDKKIQLLKDKITEDNWFLELTLAKDFNTFLSDLDKIFSSSDIYFKEEQDNFSVEFNWFQFYNSLSNGNKLIIDELKGKQEWRKSFLIHYLNSLLLTSANSDLPTNDNEHIELTATLENLEKEQLKYIKDFWFSKQIEKTRAFEQRYSNLSVENLYNKRSSPKFKRLSLRQIVQYDSDLFTSFFPIILTSPDVASNLFKGMDGYFDIVMFDEASQLRLEDNLPAILKGKQIIIAGDEHQMPPSNYFSKIFDGDVEDEDDVEEEKNVVDKDNLLLSCESLLEFASELKFEKQYLDFHYRSRHPFLIDFSNYAFYDQRLRPMPTNFDYVPIKYIQVKGTFTEHINEAEAEMVLSIIDNNINRLPNGKYPSVGIATFNITQRNLIKSKIVERQRFSKFESFNNKIQELEENGMFIKNLENIQGDERDIIILSTTYGAGKDGKFAQRFGPINHSKGYKLLNVIVTRAKYKVYVCTSIPEEVFMNYKDYLITEGSNNKRAVLYAYLAYSKAVSESNNDSRISILKTLTENTTKSVIDNSFLGGDLESPFEEEVYHRLVEDLGAEKLIAQVKVSEFRIDLVYDPKIIGIPKIAIECDGAKYHSSREAYLYDSHRQKILEGHGFVFHRIWSTNWWDNPNRETTKLIEFIKQIESSTYTLQDHYKTASAFTDNIETLQDYVFQNSNNDLEKGNEVIEQAKPRANKTLSAKIESSNTVKINSKVKVKYKNGEILHLLIIEKDKDLNKIKNNVQNIYYKSPLAVSLIGNTIGDKVKIGGVDNFVEILAIQN